jgi:hypothetical protein
MQTFYYARYLAPFGPSRRNWFCISQLTFMVIVGLQKPYSKTEVGGSCNCIDVNDSTVCVAGDGDFFTGSKIPEIHF